MEKVISELLRQWSDWCQCHFAFEQPFLTARLKQTPEDFQVDEQLGFLPSGEGSHLWLQIKKRGSNTHFVARMLAQYAEVPIKEIGYAGLKDRQAVTTQWFSVPVKKTIDWQQFQHPEIEVLNAVAHPKKIGRGVHRANQFMIILRDVTGDKMAWQQRWETICRKGVPNYFGVQRFGHAQNNINLIEDLFYRRRRLDRVKRGLALSSLRSAIFNAICSDRVAQKNWDQICVGDVAQLQGSQSFFKVSQIDTDLLNRCMQHDIHPTGPMLGQGKSLVDGSIKVLEENYQAPFLEWDGIAKFRLEHARRSLRCSLQQPEMQFLDDKTVQLKFTLPKGSYATAVLRELCQVKEDENTFK